MSDDPTTTNPHRQLKIWQQNCRKSLVNQLHMSNSLRTSEFDLCLIQEPYIDFLNNTQAPRGWRVIYPPTRYKNGPPTRSVILISPTIATANWTDLYIDSPDVTAIQIWGDFGTLRIFNVYNACEHNNSIDIVKEWYRNPEHVTSPPSTCPAPRTPIHDIWAGDFNRHHPLWDDDRNHHLFTTNALNLAQPLLDLAADHNMLMPLPKGIPTLEHSNSGNWTRLDNIFASPSISEAFTRCNTEPGMRPPKADHLPIISSITLPLTTSAPPARMDWIAVDWEQFREKLTTELAANEQTEEIKTAEELESAVERLENSINKVVNELVPFSKPSPYRKRWWNKELTEARTHF
jgi:hypothetical protein